MPFPVKLNRRFDLNFDHLFRCAQTNELELHWPIEIHHATQSVHIYTKDVRVSNLLREMVPACVLTGAGTTSNFSSTSVIFSKDAAPNPLLTYLSQHHMSKWISNPYSRGGSRVVPLDNDSGDALQYVREMIHPRFESSSSDGPLMRKMGRRFHIDPAARVVGDVVCASSQRNQWLVFHSDDVWNSVRHAISLLYFSLLLRTDYGCVINGDAVIDKRTSRSVLLLGNPMTGKTTLAHHLVASDPERYAILSTGRCFISSKGNICGLPYFQQVRVGQVLGTFYPNQYLERLIEPELAASLIQNNDEQLWYMNRTFIVPPTLYDTSTKIPHAGTLHAVAYLCWHPSRVHTIVSQINDGSQSDIGNRYLASHPIYVSEFFEQDTTKVFNTRPFLRFSDGINFKAAIECLIKALDTSP